MATEVWGHPALARRYLRLRKLVRLKILSRLILKLLLLLWRLTKSIEGLGVVRLRELLLLEVVLRLVKSSLLLGLTSKLLGLATELLLKLATRKLTLLVL